MKNARAVNVSGLVVSDENGYFQVDLAADQRTLRFQNPSKASCTVFLPKDLGAQDGIAFIDGLLCE